MTKISMLCLALGIGIPGLGLVFWILRMFVRVLKSIF